MFAPKEVIQYFNKYYEDRIEDENGSIEGNIRAS